jgi:SAM-dependent methyltransferase
MPLPSMSGQHPSVRDESVRGTAFGENWSPTLVDRFGVWLSARQIRRFVKTFKDISVADIGCGFHAWFTRSILDEVRSAVLVDVSLSPALKTCPKVHAIEGGLPDALSAIPAGSQDLVMCISVLEHLWDPLGTLKEFRRIASPGGICLFNVPSWRGKRYLELSAFRLKLSPQEEMDDHKMYYDVRDLWPLLVRAGFLPHDIHCFPHKFGLNTFAACAVPGLSKKSHHPPAIIES